MGVHIANISLTKCSCSARQNVQVHILNFFLTSPLFSTSWNNHCRTLVESNEVD